MIYLDNAATSWPKPPEVLKAMEKVIMESGCNPGRGSHQGALSAARIVFRTREILAELFKVTDPNRIVFTSNATHAINMGLTGFLKPGDHVITSSMEHNSVWRPLKYLERKGIEVEVVQCDAMGAIDTAKIKQSIRSNTKMIVTLHGSNVTGGVFPVHDIGKIAREHHLVYMVDASQTAGVIPIDIEKMKIDLLAFPGHKGLLGPQGTGGLYVGPRVNLEPLIQGGTGSHSEQEYQPEVLPDKLESGTLNTVGIAGLGAGVEYLLAVGIDAVRQRELFLCQKLVEGLSDIKKIKFYGPLVQTDRAPVISVNLGQAESNEVGFILDRAYNITIRTGLHCAPQAHKTIGTINQGTLRFSPSSFNSDSELEDTIRAVKDIAREI